MSKKFINNYQFYKQHELKGQRKFLQEYLYMPEQHRIIDFSKKLKKKIQIKEEPSGLPKTQNFLIPENIYFPENQKEAQTKELGLFGPLPRNQVLRAPEEIEVPETKFYNEQECIIVPKTEVSSETYQLVAVANPITLDKPKATFNVLTLVAAASMVLFS